MITFDPENFEIKIRIFDIGLINLREPMEWIFGDIFHEPIFTIGNPIVKYIGFARNLQNVLKFEI